jgi:apolipoprotein N-acyltransferase
MNDVKISFSGGKYKALFFSVLTGILLGVSWAPSSLAPLLFIAFIPLFFVLDECNSYKKLFLYSFIAFAIWGISVLYWMGNIVINEPKEAITFLAFVIIPLIMTIPVLVWRLTANRNKYLLWLSFPFFWTTYEFIQGRGDLAFTWLNLGLGLSSYPKLIGFYRFTGAYGGTIAILMINVLLFLIIKYRADKKIRGRILAGLASLIICITWADLAPGDYSPFNSEPDNKVAVAVVQANTDPYIKLDAHSLDAQFDTLRNMLLPLKGKHLDLIVCSEGYFRTSARPVLLNYIEQDTLIKSIKQLSLQMNAPILTGMIVQKIYYAAVAPSPTATKIKEGMYFDSYNAALLISPYQNTQVYVKDKLVPFMERTPLVGIFSFLERFHFSLNQMKSSYSRMDNQYLFTYGNMKIDPVICLEVAFPDYITGFVKKGANMIVVISNDGWVGTTSGYMQGADYALALAAEMQKPVVRCANTGVSLFIQHGKITKVGNWHEKKVIVQDVTLNNKLSFYTKYGDILGVLSIIICTCFIVYSPFKLFLRKSYK